MSTDRRIPPFVERLLLLVASPLLFLALAEGAIAISGIETDVARNEGAQIALPVWLLADETWVDDRRMKMRRSGEAAIDAADVAWLHHFQEARWIQYRMKPDVDVQAVNPFNDMEVEQGITFRLASNGSGFRDREFTPKRPGVVRVVTLGDSSTFGWGTEPEHTFQSLLADRLDAWRPGRFEVLNLGIPGHNSRHGIGILKHYALPLDPDILIVAFGANDPRWVPTPTSQVLEADEGVVGALRFAMLRLRTYRLLRRLLLTIANPLSPEPTPGELAERPRVKAVPLDDFRSNLDTIADRGAEQGASSIFMSVCTGERDYVATTRDLAKRREAPFLDVRELFTDSIDALMAGELYPEQVAHYRRIYGRPAMQNQRSLYVTNDGCHPHWVGHSLIADRLFDMVRVTLGQPVLPDPEPGDTR
jgi:lysophospholipase L1-like esterase